MTDQEARIKSQSKSIDEYFFRQRLIFIFIFGFLSGVLVSSFIFVPPILAVLFIIVSGAILLAEKIEQKKVGKEVLFAALAIISFALGAFRYDIKDFHSVNQELEAQVGKQTAVVGIVSGEPEKRDNDTRFIVSAEGEKILVYTDLFSPVRYGDEVKITGKLQKPGVIDDGTGKPFDYAQYLSKDETYYTLSFAQVEILSQDNGNPVRTALIGIKNSFISRTETILPESEAGLLSGLLIAGKQAMPKSVLDEFRRAGVIHVVVLSGFHVNVIAAFLFLSLVFVFSTFKIHSVKAPRVLAVLGIIVFVIMAGASASIIRAAVMAIIALGGKLAGRNYNAPRALLVAVFIMSVQNPKILAFDPGFHLSVLATLGMIYIAPIFKSKFSILSDFFGFRELMAITCAAQLAVIPYILYSMGQFSVVAPISNVLIIPFVSTAMLIGFTATLLSYLSNILALPFAYVAHLLLSWILYVSETLGNLTLASINISFFPLWLTLLIYLAIIIFARRFRDGKLLPGFQTSRHISRSGP